MDKTVLKQLHEKLMTDDSIRFISQAMNVTDEMRDILIAQLEHAYQAGAKEALRTDQMVDEYDFKKYYKNKYEKL